LPALSWLPGQRPAQLAACLAVGKDRHIDAELGDEHLGGALVHAADGVEPGECLGEGRHDAIDLGADGLDGLVQVVEVGEELADEEGVVGAEVADQKPQGRPLLAQLAAGETREDLGVGGAAHQGIEQARPEAPNRRVATEVSLRRIFTTM
jgi:hypothetical protein